MCHLSRIQPVVLLCFEACTLSCVVSIGSCGRSIGVCDLRVTANDTDERWAHHGSVSRLELAAEDILSDYKIIDRLLITVLDSERAIDSWLCLLLLMAGLVVRA